MQEILDLSKTESLEDKGYFVQRKCASMRFSLKKKDIFTEKS